jgi:hypothetical protein
MRTRHIYNLILFLADHSDTFTPRNLTPALTSEQARRSCLALSEMGELEIVSQASTGRAAKEAVYKLNAR